MKYRDKCLKELQKNNDLYCPYCVCLKGEKQTCCEEYKFLPFNKLHKKYQDTLVQDMVDEYEDYAQRRLF